SEEGAVEGFEQRHEARRILQAGHADSDSRGARPSRHPLGPRLRGTEDLEATPALDDRRVPEGPGHPRPNRIRALARSGDEPQAAALEQPGRSVRDDAVDDLAAGADRRIREDVVEGQVRNGLVQIPVPDFRIADTV